MLDTSTPVVLLRSVRHGGLNVTQSLGRLGIPVHIVEPDCRAPSLFSRYCKGRYAWDLERAPQRASVEFFRRLGEALGRRAILIATTDLAAAFLAGNAEQLSAQFLFRNASHELVRSLRNKRRMYLLARSLGVPAPVTAFPESFHDVLEFADKAMFPVILKTIEERPGASSRKRLAENKRELLDRYSEMEGGNRGNVLLQEFIPGGDSASWMFNGYFDDNSDCLFEATGTKLRQNPPYAGIATLAVCRPNPKLAETVKDFMKAIGYRGILDIGFRFDERDGRYKVFDINPRIGCTFRLFVSDTGMDVVRALYADLTGQRFKPGNIAPGRKWVVEDLDFASALRYWRDGKLGTFEWLASYRGVRETALFAVDDPRATVSLCSNAVRGVWSRFRRRAARSGAAADSEAPALASERTSKL